MQRKIVGGLVCVAVVAAGVAGQAATAQSATAPSSVTVKETSGASIKANRYIQDELRFDKDVYRVKSGGKVTLLLTAADEGPHTLSVVKPADLPKSGPFRGCPVCDKLTKAHGADPNTEGPPKFTYLENGKGQKTSPNLDRPGDSGVTGDKKGTKATFKVTAKPGTTLSFVCIVHPWMQAKLKVS